MIVFIPETHKYVSVNPLDTTDWKSVTTVLSNFKNPFDGKAISEKVSRKQGSKWFGLDPAEIRQIWEDESNRAINLGNFYHDREEMRFLSNKTMHMYGEELPVIWYIKDEHGRKVASDQRLISGIYPEHMVYLKSAAIVGQSDRVEVAQGKIHVGDYKTNKTIEYSSFVDWEGNSKKMLGPVSHLDDCNYNHYNLQLSIYMYMMLKHNPRLKPGNITVYHIEFEQAGENKWGYPIEARDANGDPIVKKENVIQMDYLAREAHDIIEYIKVNPIQSKKAA
jgi:hypothetical protein